MAVCLNVNKHKIQGVELVIFDKDGTLIDVHHYWVSMIKLRSEIISSKLNIDKDVLIGLMDSMGVKAGTMRIKPDGPVGLKKREVVMNAGVSYLRTLGHEGLTSLFLEAFSRADELSLSRFDEMIRPIAGLNRCMDALKTVGCQIAIATTDRTDRTKSVLQHLKIHHKFDCIAGADLVRMPKPSGEIVELVCRQLKVPVENAVMVGDAASDILSGQAAGCKASIGVASGLTEKNKLETLTPFVLNSIKDILISTS